MKVKGNKNKNIIYMIVIFLVTIVVFAELFFSIRYKGHDTIFHVANIIKLSESISFDNLFGSNLITQEFNKFGYGIWIFYPKLPHLTAAYIHLIIKDIYLSMNIVYVITSLLSGIFTFFLSKKIFSNNKVALLSSLIYIVAPYHMCEIYIRDAFAENFMFMVLPMIFLGLYSLKDNEYMKFYIFFILGYVIGINSHLGSMFFYTIFIGLFILYYRREFFKKEKFRSLLISSLVVFLVCLPFLGPLLEHKFFGNYRVFTDYFSNIDKVQMFSLNFKDLFSQISINDNIHTYFNVMTIILFCLSLFYFIFLKKDSFKEEKKSLLLLIVILLNFICSKAIWEFLPSIFYCIQFPWRLLVLLILFVALFSPLCFIDSSVSNKIKNILFILCSFVIIFEGIGNISFYSNYEVLEEDALASEYSLGYQKEYFPIMDVTGVEIFYSNGHNYKIKDYEFRTNDDNVFINIIKDDFPNMEFTVENVDTVVSVEFPRIFYFGYELLDEDGNSIDLTCNKYGMIEASINSNGKYRLSYVKSKINKISDIISLITVICVLGVLVVKFIKWKRKKLLY